MESDTPRPTFPALGMLLSGRFRLLRPLGSGAMASVYLAEDTQLANNTVAIKILHPGSNPEMLIRFRREVQLLNRINHPNVVRTYDFGQDGELHYYTMEYVDGEPLGAVLNRDRTLTISRALSIATQIIHGLEAIHALDVVHRDLKPDNIIIRSSNGVATITDFGIAKSRSSAFATSGDSVVGTLAYMAPEILEGSEPSPASDYYALGLVIYKMITGELAFDSDAPARLIMLHVRGVVKHPNALRPEIPLWLNTFILRLLMKDPRTRVKDLGGFITLCERVASSEELGSSKHPVTIGSSLSLRRPSQPATQPELTALEESLVDSFDFPSPDTSRKPAPRRIVRSIIVALAVYTVLALTPLYDRVSLGFADSLFLIRGHREPPPDVVLVTMDEQSYRNLGVGITSPWPRSLHARLLQRLATLGAKRVAFDILFLGAGPDSRGDEELAAALKSIPVILGAASAVIQKATLNGSFILEETLFPYDQLRRNAAGIGFVSLPDDRGVIRRFNTEHVEGFPSLAEAAADITDGSPVPDSNDLINYYGPSGTLTSVPYESVLETKASLPPALFKDKLVMVGLLLRGSVGAAQRDAFLTPYPDQVFGAEIHATATLNLIHQEWIQRLPYGHEMPMGAFLSVVIGVLLGMLVGLRRLLAISGLILGWMCMAYVSFIYLSILAPGALAVFAVGPATLAVLILTEQAFLAAQRSGREE